MNKEKQYKAAGFSVRFLAYVLDLLFLMVIFNFIEKLTPPLPASRFTIFTEAMNLIVSMLYFTVFTASKMQATLGKRIFGLKIINENSEPLNLFHSFGRYLAYFFSYITFGLGFLVIIIDKKHLSLHDRIASTRVVIPSPSYN
ncbi:MAG: RDD family protein [Pseudomonadota bacterium]